MSQPASQPVPAPASGLDAANSKERLLDAAEQEFAQRGFGGTSMRRITQAAGMSVSAANYHFGSKEDLHAAVIRRRVEPLNAQRMAAFEALAARPTLEAVFAAYFEPAFERFEEARRGGNVSFPRQVAARLFSEPQDVVGSLRTELFGEVNVRFREVLARALPGAPAHVVGLAQQLATATMLHVLSGQLDEELLGDLTARAASDDALGPLLEAMVAYAVAGTRVLVAEGEGR